MPPVGGAPRDAETPLRRAMTRLPSFDTTRMPSPSVAKRSSRLIFGYWLATFGSFGMQYAFGPIFAMLIGALGDHRGVTALVGSLCVGIEDVLGAVLSAWAILRFGPRRCLVIASVLSALGWSVSSLVSELWQLLCSYSVIIGIGHSLALFSAIMTTNMYFDKRLALAHAIGSTGGAATPFLSGLLTPQLATAVGWRNALRVYAAVNCGVLLVAALLLWQPPPPPEEKGQKEGVEVIVFTHNPIESDAVPADAAKAPIPLNAAPERDAQFPELIQLLRRNRPLQATMLASFFIGLGSWIVIVHIVKLAMDNGMSASEASQLTTYLALGGLVMRIPAGMLADVFGRIKICVLANFCFCLCHILIAIPGAASSKLILTLFAVGVGGFGGANFCILPAVPSELKLPKRFSNIMSVVILSPSGLGLLAGPPIAGAMHTSFGSYQPAMLFSASCSAMGCALLILAAVLLHNVPTVGGNDMAKKMRTGSTPLTLPTVGGELVLVDDGGNDSAEDDGGNDSADETGEETRSSSDSDQHAMLVKDLNNLMV